MFITNIRLQDWLGKALQEIAQSENKSLAKTITDILTTAVMSTHVDEYIESLMYIVTNFLVLNILYVHAV